MNKIPAEGLVNFLQQFMLEARLEKFNEVLSQRTRHLTVVLEDIYQSQNASAVLRTCECLGIQDVHIIENENQFDVNPDVVKGASKWLSLYKYNQAGSNTIECLSSLKEKGYQIIGTSPLPQGKPLKELDISHKTALVFGTEQHGLSGEALDLADAYLNIPMMGFTESFNISVSAAICLHHLVNKLHNSNIKWELSHEELLEVKLDWIKKTLRNPEPLIDHFLRKESVG